MKLTFFSPPTDIASMVEKGIHIAAQLAGIPMAGCRDANYAN
ncbi:hypothetical protein METH_17150 [Leisingera methylohalidivorans DSM 14336]|uniref:Uncharacterized protein n=1 Tax=Leisingera methylohalidivorans DSM 14336 TaxID=999552 RepID=V9W223_9RHOB|nr:hypothetical protein METH_17150 [Leisingera methylohalidivorans DSM 14336]